MTYLDPNHARGAFDWTKFLIRTLVIVGVAAFGWFAVTLGSIGTRPAPVDTISLAF